MTRLSRLAAGASTTALALVTLGACSSSTAAPAAGAPANVVIAGGNQQSGTVGVALANPLLVTVTDGNGRPVPGAAVAWSVTAGGGTITGAPTSTDASGAAAALLTLGTVAGGDTVVASVSNGATLITQTFAANALAGPLASIQVVSGAAQAATAGSTLANPIVVRAVDVYGNPISGLTLTWTAQSGAVANATTTTDANGYASNVLTLGSTAGGTIVSVTASTALGATVRADISETGN